MTRNDTTNEVVDACMQQELVADNQHLNKNERKAKNKPRKKHPVYNNLRKTAKKSCGGSAKDSVKTNANKFQDKRDNSIVEQQKIDATKLSSPKEIATKLADIPDSWELLCDLNLLPSTEKWSMAQVLEQKFVASSLMGTTAASAEHVSSEEFQQTEESLGSSSSSCDDRSWSCDDKSRKSIDKFDKKMSKEKSGDNSSTPLENLSTNFLLRPQEFQDSLPDSLDLASEIKADESGEQQKISSTAVEVIREKAQITTDILMFPVQQKTTFSESGASPWEGNDDLASTSNDFETVNWSCELHSNEENEQVARRDGDDPYKNWTERPRRGTLRAVRYKTEMCRTYEEGLTCTYGVRCQFAHGFHELRFQPRHPKHKTELCHMFHSMGFCRYGRRCSFVHTESTSLLTQMRLNQQQQQQEQEQQHIYKGQKYAAICSNDTTMDQGIESASGHGITKKLIDSVQLQARKSFSGELPQRQTLENAMVTNNERPLATNRTQLASEQKMVCIVNGALPPVHWTNAAILYLPCESCTEAQSMQSSPFSLRNFSSNNNYALYGQQQQLGHGQPQQQQQQPLQQTVVAYQASNGVVYFNYAFQVAPNTDAGLGAATATTTSTATAPPASAATTNSTVVNTVPFHAASLQQSKASTAPPHHRIFPNLPTQNLPASYYAAPTLSQPVLGNSVNKFFQVVPHLGAVPYVGNVYYVSATATAAEANGHSTAAHGNYAYTTNA